MEVFGLVLPNSRRENSKNTSFKKYDYLDLKTANLV
jgi:hypothetical protein